MRSGVYNDQLRDAHNARPRSAEICHMNFPSPLQHTVILGRAPLSFLPRVRPLPPYDTLKTFQLDCDGLFGPFDLSSF